MDEDNILDVGRTIELFDLSVEDQMLPHGSNPKGMGSLLKHSNRKLSALDVPRLVIGATHPPPYPIEYGREAEFENLCKNEWGYEWAGVDEKGNSAEVNMPKKEHVPRRRTHQQGNLKKSWHALRLLREKEEKEKLKKEYVKEMVTGKAPIPSAIDKEIRIEQGIDGIELSAKDKEEALAEYKATLPPFHLDSLIFALRDDKRPNFNIEHVANLIQYNEVDCEFEQPKWRAELIKAHGPAGNVI